MTIEKLNNGKFLHRVEGKHCTEQTKGRIAELASPSDWKALVQKKIVESIDAYQTIRRTQSDTKPSVASLKLAVADTMDRIKNRDYQFVAEIQDEMDSLRDLTEELLDAEIETQTSNEITELRKEVDSLREDLKGRAKLTEFMSEIREMKKSIEIEINDSEGKTREELDTMRKIVASANASDLKTKTMEELTAIKQEFEQLKKEIRARQLALPTKNEILFLKQKLETERLVSDIETKAELTTLSNMIHSLQTTLANKKTSTTDVVAVKRELEALKKELRFKERNYKNNAKLEAHLLKTMIKTTTDRSEAKTHEQITAMKRSIDKLAEQKAMNRNLDEISSVKAEMIGVKEELKQVEKLSKTQETLKENMHKVIDIPDEKTREDLVAIKTVLTSMYYDNLESRNLKDYLQREFEHANEKTEAELQQMKAAVDSINVNELELRSKNDFISIRKHINDLIKNVKAVDDAEVETKRELLEVKLSLSAIEELNDTESKRQEQFSEIRTEMANMKERMKRLDLSEFQKEKKYERFKPCEMKSKPKTLLLSPSTKSDNKKPLQYIPPTSGMSPSTTSDNKKRLQYKRLKSLICFPVGKQQQETEEP